MTRPVVHILITVRKPELLEASTLVLRSVRTGFPTSDIRVYVNGRHSAPLPILDAVHNRCREDGIFPVWTETTHPDWIRRVISENSGVHWICDPDVWFFEKVEHWDFEGAEMAGMYIPRFRCPYVKAVTLGRLHTALMWLNCDALKSFLCEENETFMAPIDYISPRKYRHEGEWYFTDTMGGMYGRAIGQSFSPEQLDCWGHLHNGTISDLTAPVVPGIQEFHKAAVGNPELLRGAWRRQLDWYEQRKCHE